MNGLTIILIIITLSSSTFARSPSWFRDRMQEIDNGHTLSKDSQINSLGVLVAIGQSRMDDEQRLVYLKAQSAMIAIPGHAEYYREKILKAQERAKSIGPTALYEYSNEIMYGFQTLPLLHSPEGVRVLGELLQNDWVPPGNETAALSEKFNPLSISARVTLQKFPLLDKPFNARITGENVADAQAAWKQWFEQIKAGKRTFRFEGDPTEYDLNGPAPGQKIAQISRDEKRDSQRTTRQSKTKITTEESTSVSRDEKTSLTATIVATVILCGLAIWYPFRNRKLNRR